MSCHAFDDGLSLWDCECPECRNLQWQCNQALRPDEEEHE